MPRSPSGEQVHLAFGDQTAIVTEVGASLRAYRASGVDVIAGYGEDEIAGGGRGQVLAPWPNRLEDGSFSFSGLDARAALDEPAHQNAIHGLVRWLRWRFTGTQPHSVRLECDLAPQPAFPFELALALQYSLSATGLEVRTEASCVGSTALPFGLGFHPYLGIGTATVDSTLFTLPAATRLLLDQRALPVGSEPVEGGSYDFRSGRAVGTITLDDCFTDLAPSESGLVEVRLAAPGRPAVVLWADPAFSHLMCYTGDTLGDEATRRRSIAIEPMTCPPNALRSGEGVIVLHPGETWTASWGIRLEAEAS